MREISYIDEDELLFMLQATAESEKLPCVSSDHKQSSEAAANTEPHNGSPVTARTGKKFTFRELATATNNFRSDRLLGEGGFGRVYKGQLENGQVYTITISGKHSSYKISSPVSNCSLIQLFFHT